ncbi:uncharacterized protein LOC131875143 [Cryptomeria japonica]|uniref:uncharacterized protein LOC131875143 n=1 Tax=Cryptomeria japonica TaxID=3369 RepID=UPI0027DA70D0|nr:uncharacterized protein LOC131875143 [Cryptomeria japonica]
MGERRKRLGLVGSTKFSMCGEAEDDLDHLLLQCKIVQKCWYMVKGKLQWQGPLPNSLKDMFDSWPRLNKKSKFSSIWNICPSLVIWEIWKERNRRIFQDKAEDVRRLFIRLDQAIEETLGAGTFQMNSTRNPFTIEDMKIQKAWPNVKIRHGAWPSRMMSKKCNSPTEWVPPQRGLIKANFDGASQRGGGLLGVGVVFRDHSDIVVKLGAQRIKQGTNNEAKAYLA